MKHIAILSLLVGCLSSMSKPAVAQPKTEAGKAFASGKSLLLKADFDGALAAFKAAAKADTENPEYAQQHAMLRQVIHMRRDLSNVQDAEQWLRMADALRTFYYDHGLYSEALPLDRERHKRNQSTESAVLLADTQLSLGMNSQAIEMFRAMPKKQTSPRMRVLHGLALARLGHIKEANKTAKVPWQLKDDLGPAYFYDLARLHTLVGESRKAFDALTRSFELTAPSQLERFKTKARGCGDFSTIRSAAGFVKALSATSKVKESSCSQGAACGKCPQRAKCGTKSANDDEKGS